MRIEEIGGKKEIVLDENDSITLSTENDAWKIVVSCESDKLNISGSSLAIGQIRGKGMLEKVYIPPVLSYGELVVRCEEWLDMFNEELEYFRDFVRRESFHSDSKIMLEVNFNIFHSTIDSTVGRTIRIDLVSSTSVVQEGASIYVDDENGALYGYLVASVVSKYLSVCRDAIKVDIGISWDKNLHDCSRDLSTMYLSNLLQDSEYSKIIYQIIGCHNIGISTDQIISDLREQIMPQCLLSSNFDDSITRSKRRHENIISEKEKKLTMQKVDEKEE